MNVNNESSNQNASGNDNATEIAPPNQTNTDTEAVDGNGARAKQIAAAARCVLVYVSADSANTWLMLGCFPIDNSDADGTVKFPGIGPAHGFRARLCLADLSKCSAALRIFGMLFVCLLAYFLINRNSW